MDIKKAKIITETNKTSDSDWFDIRNIPELAYDYNEILNGSIESLKSLIQTTDILKSLFPNEFTLPELHQVYESILNINIDRRNFRKKMINSGFVKDTNKTITYKGKKPAKLYVLNKFKENKSIF